MLVESRKNFLKLLARWESFLEGCKKFHSILTWIRYSHWSLCAICILELPKFVKAWNIHYILSGRLMPSPIEPVSKVRALCSMQNTLLGACSWILAFIGKNFYVPGLHVDFRKWESKCSLMDYLILKECEDGRKERTIRTWIWDFLFGLDWSTSCTRWM